MATTRQEFMAVIESSPTKAEAARRLGITQQSLTARLTRIKLCPQSGGRPGIPNKAMTDAELEKAWSDALEVQDLAVANLMFGQMCDRTAKKTARKRR